MITLANYSSQHITETKNQSENLRHSGLPVYILYNECVFVFHFLWAYLDLDVETSAVFGKFLV